jgi:hypothetical protein
LFASGNGLSAIRPAQYVSGRSGEVKMSMARAELKKFRMILWASDDKMPRTAIDEPDRKAEQPSLAGPANAVLDDGALSGCKSMSFDEDAPGKFGPVHYKVWLRGRSESCRADQNDEVKQSA